MSPARDACHVSMSVPRQWRTHSDPASGAVIAARARQVPASGFAPELVLRTTPFDDTGPSSADWRSHAIAALATELVAFDLEDTDDYDLGGRPVTYHRFSHRVRGIDVVCDRWSWLEDTVGVTLTGSVARVDYPDYYDLFEDVAATVEIGGGLSAA